MSTSGNVESGRALSVGNRLEGVLQHRRPMQRNGIVRGATAIDMARSTLGYQAAG
jgi:hypothetical protein